LNTIATQRIRPKGAAMRPRNNFQKWRFADGLGPETNHDRTSKGYHKLSKYSLVLTPEQDPPHQVHGHWDAPRIPLDALAPSWWTPRLGGILRGTRFRAHHPFTRFLPFRR